MAKDMSDANNVCEYMLQSQESNTTRANEWWWDNKRVLSSNSTCKNIIENIQEQ